MDPIERERERDDQQPTVMRKSISLIMKRTFTITLNFEHFRGMLQGRVKGECC